jgi:molecular chaperone DnaK (HSP70)
MTASVQNSDLVTGPAPRPCGGTLAIDLGSTTTVVAHQLPGALPYLLPVGPYSLSEPVVVPSLLWLHDAKESRPLIGRQVIDAGLAHGDGPQLQRDFKRQIGAATDRTREQGWPLTPETAGALLLTRLWHSLPDGIRPDRLVLTAPIESYRGYRQWLLDVCSQWEVPSIALVDEPTAAAIGAGLPPGSTVLVVDLGGGTTDLSLVRLQGGEGRAAPIAQLLRFAGRDLSRSRQALRCAQVIGKAGLEIGGRDIDRWIAASLCPDLPPSGPLLDACERLKCTLANQDEALVLWAPAGEAPRELHLTLRQLQTLLEQHGLLAQLDQLLKEVLAAGRKVGVKDGEISAVLPVGGSSRLHAIRGWIQSQFPGIAISDQRPVEAVALGALALTPDVKVKDVLAKGVSLRCWAQREHRHHWHPLFLPGQAWPTQRPLELVLACSRDGQESLELILGEPVDDQRREVVFENGLPVVQQRAAGSAAIDLWSQQPQPLPLTPLGHQGEDRLRLSFSIDTEGQLLLECNDLLTGNRTGPLRLGTVR